MIIREYLRRCEEWSDIVDHLPRLHDEASIGDAVVIELGVRSGNSTAAFLAAIETNGGFLHSVDIRPCQLPWGTHPQWSFTVGDDLVLADDLPDDVDIVFIDTSHHYLQTLAELELFAPKVKPGGVVLLHDTELEHPDGAPASDPPYPVAAALRQYAADTGATVEWVTGCNGLGVIHIPR